MLIRRDHADVSGDHRSHEICHIAYLHVVLRGPNFVYFDFIWWWLRFELRFVWCVLYFGSYFVRLISYESVCAC